MARKSIVDSTLAELALVLVFVFAMVAVGVASVPSPPPPPSPPSPPSPSGGNEGDKGKLIEPGGWGPPGASIWDVVKILTRNGKYAPCIAFRTVGPYDFLPYGATFKDIANAYRVERATPIGELMERSVIAVQYYKQSQAVAVIFNLAIADPNAPTGISRRKPAYFQSTTVRDSLIGDPAAGGVSGALATLIDTHMLDGRIGAAARDGAVHAWRDVSVTLPATQFESRARALRGAVERFREEHDIRCAMHADYFNTKDIHDRQSSGDRSRSVENGVRDLQAIFPRNGGINDTVRFTP